LTQLATPTAPYFQSGGKDVVITVTADGELSTSSILGTTTTTPCIMSASILQPPSHGL
jgi:hypothetical protein